MVPMNNKNKEITKERGNKFQKGRDQFVMKITRCATNNDITKERKL